MCLSLIRINRVNPSVAANFVNPLRKNRGSVKPSPCHTNTSLPSKACIFLNKKDSQVLEKSSREPISSLSNFQEMKNKRNCNIVKAQDLTLEELRQRREIVMWTYDISIGLGIAPETIHRAIFYLDHIITENHVDEDELQEIALICLLLAAKLSESYNKVNSIARLFKEKKGSTKNDISKYEIQILGLLRWNLSCVTIIEFIQFFISQQRVLSSEMFDCPLVSGRLLIKVNEYCTLALKEYELVTADRLVLAASVIAAARKSLGIKNAWPKELYDLTSVKEEEMRHCLRVLLREKAEFSTEDINEESAECDYDRGIDESVISIVKYKA